MLTEYMQKRIPDLMDELTISVSVLGKEDGTIRYVNERMCKELGKKQNEICRQSYRNLFCSQLMDVYDSIRRNCQEDEVHSVTYYSFDKQQWKQLSIKRVSWDAIPCFLLSIIDVISIGYLEQ